MGWRKPLNKTRQGGSLDTFQMQVGTNATAAKMLPGIVVAMDTNSYSVKEWNTGGQMIGYLSYENSTDKPDTIDTPYSIGDAVGVEVGAGRRQLARLASSQTIGYGQPLALDADGYLKAAVVGTDDVVADAAEPMTTTTGTGKIWITTRR